MESNGTISHWKTADGTNILFPEAELAFGKEKKLRGGAPVCCPNFGTAPTDGPYKGIELPKHGLVRTCQIIDGKPVPGNRAIHQSESVMLNDNGWMAANYHFMAPWCHEAWVSVNVNRLSESIDRMRHRLLLRTDLIHDTRMPYSLGFHPYFATGGNAFTLCYGDQGWTVYSVGVDKPFFVPAQESVGFVINTAHGTTLLNLVRGYNGFFVWTDRPDSYICVEPVLVGKDHRYLMLEAGEEVICECTITHKQVA